MKFAPIVIACALAAGGTAFAQNESANAPASNNGQPSQSASELGNKAKNGMHTLGEKTRNAFNKLRGKSSAATAKSDARDHDTKAMGAGKSSRDTAASSSTTTGGSDMSGSRQQRMDDAYANYQKQSRK